MRRNQQEPEQWQKKRGNHCSISQFRNLALLSVEGKIFFSVLARRMSNSPRERLPPLRCYMDNITTIPQVVPFTTRLQKQLEELIYWARIYVEATKLRSLLIRKRVLQDKTTFTVGAKAIPQLAEKSLKGLGKQNCLTDRWRSKSSITCRWTGKKNKKSAPREAQGVVLPAYTASTCDVAPRDLRSPHVRGQQDGRPSRRPHQEVDQIASLFQRLAYVDRTC